MKLQTLSVVLNALLLYFLCLLLFIGLFGNDVVNNLLDIAILYGVPLFGLVVVYVVRMAFELTRYVKTREGNWGLVSVVSLKMAIATTPMFLLDNSLASLLVRMRLA